MDSSPEQLRSILKSSLPPKTSPTTEKTARKVFVSHSQHLQLISLLPGWRSDRLRMPWYNDKKDTVVDGGITVSIDASQDRGGTLKLRRLSLFVPAKKKRSMVRMAAGVESIEKKRRRKTGQAIAMDSSSAPTSSTAPRGILKLPGRPFPPPRKSSLSATAGKTIVKKYRKVRVSRLLRFKLIQAVPGFRSDRPRLPHIDPDEEEQQRLADQEKSEKDEKRRRNREARQARARNRRKTVGASSAAPSSDDESGAEESSNSADMITARSPDVYCEAYMQVDSPDAVLTDREAAGWRDKQLHTIGGALFPIDNREDTVAQTTVSIAAKPSSAPRRRSLRIQEREEARRVQADAAATAAAAASPAQVEKRQRRRSRMFATPDASPVARRRRSSVSNEKSDQSQRRKSRMFVRLPAASADELSEKSGRSDKSDEQMEFARCSDSYESQCTQWSSGCELLAEAFSPPRKPMRRGRRSMKLALEDIPSSEAEEPRQHPFFSQFAASPIAATVATVLAARKPAAARRRTFFVPKKSVPEPEEESDGDSDEVVKKMRRLSVLPGKDDVQ